MSRRILLVLGLLALLGITSAGSVSAYILLIGGSGKASQPISAPTLDMSTPTADAAQTQIALLSTEVDNLMATNSALSNALSTAKGNPAANPTAAVITATAMAPSTAAVAPQTSQAPQSGTPTAFQPSSGAKLFRISQMESQVSFTISEDLFDEQNTVVGATDQVAGDIAVDFSVPASSKLGIIRINARTITTDSPFRDESIRAKILESSKAEYEFIEFTPQSIQGLPDKIEAGKTVLFQVVGNLKIREIVRSVTFDVTLTASAAKVEGSAKAVITRDQFDLQIPSVPGVANVANEVALAIMFVAAPVSQ